MLRGNLSTRPFYNERAVHLVLGAITLVLALLAIAGITRFLTLSREQTALSARIAVDEQRAAERQREAARVRAGVNQAELNAIVAATREVNRAIDERVFSWTALFNTIERTIPAEVLLTSVYPTIQEGTVMVRLVVKAARADDVGTFIDALEAAGSFRGIRTVEEVREDDGTLVVTFDGVYSSDAGEPAAPETATSEAAR
jgi:Tfp pilus assembly protein PilN